MCTYVFMYIFPNVWQCPRPYHTAQRDKYVDKTYLHKYVYA